MINPFNELTSKIFSGVSVVLFLLLGLQTWQLGKVKDKLDDKTKELGSCELKVTISNQSVGLLQSTIEGKNAESEARAAALEESKRKLSLSNAENDAKFAATQRKMNDLLDNVGKEHGLGCKTPDLGI